jgi:TrmH family RNA methyltransferase
MTAEIRAPIASRPNLENLCLVLVSTRNPLNLGAAARAMSNFGFLQLRLVHPYDRAFREARSAVGASAVLQKATEFSSVPEAVADCSLVVGTTSLHRRAPEQPAKTLAEAAATITTHLTSGRCAILFGSEKVGLPTEALDHCHFLLRIPTRAAHPSMNLGQAVAVCLYELAREERRLPKQTAAVKATAGNLERLTVSLLTALELSGYIKPGTENATERKLRRLLHRIEVEPEDAELLLGMLHQILWKLRER